MSQVFVSDDDFVDSVLFSRVKGLDCDPGTLSDTGRISAGQAVTVIATRTLEGLSSERT